MSNTDIRSVKMIEAKKTLGTNEWFDITSVKAEKQIYVKSMLLMEEVWGYVRSKQSIS